jgi:hypothetical protein
VRDEARRRRAELVAQADAPWLDLAGPALPSGPVVSTGPAVSNRPGGSAAGSVVGVLALATADDPAALLRRARAALAPGGRLLLFEPYRRAGWAGVATRWSAPLVRALTGLRVDLPVPALVREAGFVIATIERVTMPTPIAPLRSFCVVVTCPVDDDRQAVGEVTTGAVVAGVRP